MSPNRVLHAGLRPQACTKHEIGFGHLDVACASNVQVQTIWLLAHFWTHVFWTNHTSLQNLETKNDGKLCGFRSKTVTVFMWLPKQNCHQNHHKAIIHVAPLFASFSKLHFKSQQWMQLAFKDATRGFRSNRLISQHGLSVLASNVTSLSSQEFGLLSVDQSCNT